MKKSLFPCVLDENVILMLVIGDFAVLIQERRGTFVLEYSQWA